MSKGFGKERATAEDWTNHLTTIFTEVRLKRYIEIRSADSQPPALMLALPALCKGILYDNDCMAGAWDMIKQWTFRERLGLTDAAQKIGLEARAGRIKLQELALELLNIAMIGLARQHALDEAGNDESVYLLRILDQVRMGFNQASLTIERWKGRWNYDVQRLVEACSYEAEAAF
jgi:glutamate--cysteine ligase